MEESENKTSRLIIRDIATKYALSGVAATVAETVTFPMDLTKTRLQIQGEMAGEEATKKGMTRIAVDIVKLEGPTKLWQGLSPAIYRQLIYTGARLIAYEEIRNHVLHKNKNEPFPLWKAAINGLLAGVIGQLIASPMDLVKVQMQMEGRRRLEGKTPRVKSVPHALKTIVKTGGVKGLWAGWVPNVQRAALVNMGDLATYDKAKRALLSNTNIPDNWVCHAIASIFSGFASASLGTPADVVKTRIMNQPRDSNGQGLHYKSSIDCLLKTVKSEGAMSLYKGFIPIWTRMAPWSLTFWVTYENVRKIFGMKSF